MNEQFTSTRFELHNQHLRDLRRKALEQQAARRLSSRPGGLQHALQIALSAARRLSGRMPLGTAGSRAGDRPSIVGELARTAR